MFTYNEAIDSIYKNSSANTIDGVKYNLKNILSFLKILGDPQNNYKSIHIAGTSGKGSTATIISKLLVCHGFKVGLTLSPHILDIRERLMLNNQHISKSKFAQYYSEIYPWLHKFNLKNAVPLSFFETITSLAFYSFDREKVDYAVIETGLGGTLDATNTISRVDKLSVVSKIGLDHTQILGNSIREIAKHKAGIIQKKNTCVTTAEQEKEALKVLKDRCKVQNSQLILAKPYNGQIAYLNLKGQYQLENIGLAMAAFEHIASHDKFAINPRNIHFALSHINIPARFTIINHKNGPIILDGAHNVQKMKAFTESLVLLYPKSKFTFILAFKQGKDWQGMVDLIRPLALRIYATTFKLDYEPASLKCVAPELIVNYCKSIGFKSAEYLLQADLGNVIETFTDVLVFTGSLYFMSNILTNNSYLRNRYKIVIHGET